MHTFFDISKCTSLFNIFLGKDIHFVLQTLYSVYVFHHSWSHINVDILIEHMVSNMTHIWLFIKQKYIKLCFMSCIMKSLNCKVEVYDNFKGGMSTMHSHDLKWATVMDCWEVNPGWGHSHMSANIIIWLSINPFFTQILQPMTPFFTTVHTQWLPFFNISNFFVRFFKVLSIFSLNGKFSLKFDKIPYFGKITPKKAQFFFFFFWSRTQ